MFLSRGGATFGARSVQLSRFVSSSLAETLSRTVDSIGDAVLQRRVSDGSQKQID